MNSEIFRPIIDELVELGVDRETADCFANNLHVRSYSAKDTIFSEGDSLPDIAYMLSGYTRLYRTEENGDHSIKMFAAPRNFIGCIDAILYGRAAQYSADCITDCQLVVIDHHYQSVIKADKRTRLFLQDIIIRHLVALAQEKTDLLPLKATERYLYFQEHHPIFTKHIPAGLIANYIGVRPQSLSRIKQNLKLA